MDTRIPSPNVKANPLIKAVPCQNNTTAEMIDEILASRIDAHARLNPVSTDAYRFFPFLISSFIRSKIRIFASTAIPIEIMNPAIPADVKVTGINLKRYNITAVYTPSATTAMRPGRRYQRIRIIETSINPIIPE